MALACLCLALLASQACSKSAVCVGRAWHSSSAATAVRVSLLRHSSCQPAMAPQCAATKQCAPARGQVWTHAEKFCGPSSRCAWVARCAFAYAVVLQKKLSPHTMPTVGSGQRGAAQLLCCCLALGRGAAPAGHAMPTLCGAWALTPACFGGPQQSS